VNAIKDKGDKKHIIFDSGLPPNIGHNIDTAPHQIKTKAAQRSDKGPYGTKKRGPHIEAIMDSCFN
jgi:hypothetical protein